MYAGSVIARDGVRKQSLFEPGNDIASLFVLLARAMPGAGPRRLIEDGGVSEGGVLRTFGEKED